MGMLDDANQAAQSHIRQQQAHTSQQEAARARLLKQQKADLEEFVATMKSLGVAPKRYFERASSRPKKKKLFSKKPPTHVVKGWHIAQYAVKGTNVKGSWTDEEMIATDLERPFGCGGIVTPDQSFYREGCGSRPAAGLPYYEPHWDYGEPVGEWLGQVLRKTVQDIIVLQRAT